MSKKILGRLGNNRGHWVGDGFPVRSLFFIPRARRGGDPFLLLDYAGPYNFDPAPARAAWANTRTAALKP